MWYGRGVITLWVVLLVLPIGHGAYGHGPESESASPGDYGWDLRMPVGSGWLPHVATNRAGTFLRQGDALVLLAGMDHSMWQSLWASLLYGGAVPASLLGASYLVLLTASVADASAQVNIANPLLIGASGTSFAVAINSWFWQLRSLINHGLGSGMPHMLANTLGGVESHYYGMRAFQQAQQHNTLVQPRLVNANHLFVLATVFAAWGGRSLYTSVTGTMLDSLNLSLPDHLLERGFITVAAGGSGPELRIHRVPKVLRKEGFEHLRESESVWHSLLKVMDRDRIDQLAIEPMTLRGKLVLHLRFLDSQSQHSASVMMETHMPGTDIVWLEQVLTERQARISEANLQSLLHPVYIALVIDALKCLPKVSEQETFHRCGSSVLLQTGEPGSRQLRWVQSEEERVDLPQLWPSINDDRTLLYFEQPLNAHAPFLSWKDGPVLALRDGHDPKPQDVHQYHINERSIHILASELDYLARYLPHALLGLVVVPALQGMSSGCQLSGETMQALNKLELMARNYAPGWMTNLGTVMGLIRRGIR